MKNKKNIIVFIIVAILIGLFIFGGEDLFKEEIVDLENKMEVHFIDVGQGDAALIKTENQSMLIDAGTNAAAETVVNYIKNQGVDRLDYIIGTHPHEDHIGGLDNVIDSFDIGEVIMPGVTHTTKTFEDVLNSIERKSLEIDIAEVGKEYKLGEGKFTIVGPNSEKYNNLNDYSVSLKLEYGNTSFMLTGDAEANSEKEMIESIGYDLRSDVLSLGHHGSNTSTTEEFLDMVDPQIAVISAGIDNSYGHPHKEVLDRLELKDIEILGTYEKGDIILISDGNSIEIKDGNTFKAENKNDILINIKKIFDFFSD